MFRRKVNGQCVEDPSTIDNIEYNAYSGAQKNIEVGPALEYKAALGSEQGICPGDQLYIFKATAGLGYVTLSETTGVVAGAAPAEHTYPVFGQVYTAISAANYKYIIGNSADIHLYVLRDDNQERVNP